MSQPYGARLYFSREGILMKKIGAFFAAVVFLGVQATCFACTSFQVKAEDGTVVVGRSNEFGIDAESQIVFEPAGKLFASKAPDGGKGKSWTSKYAYLGINGLGLAENFADGMSEAGLSIEGLYFTESQYETPGTQEAGIAVSNNDFVSWVLGNFATVDEVKEALPSIRIWGETVAAISGPMPLHFAIHDASGKCIVVEFIGGVKKIYDNPIGVMTNMPEFPWQVTNLRNYLNLSVLIPKAKDFNGIIIKPTGTGSGWHGIPGDWSPPSRFVRIAYLVNATPQAKDRTSALNLAKHILNTVDIPKGSVEAEIKGKDVGVSIAKEYTQWSLLLDLTNRVMYYYSYDDMNLKLIDLKKMATDKTLKEKFISMAQGFSAQDVGQKMQEMK
jgi:choloylglycine hydrolase